MRTVANSSPDCRNLAAGSLSSGNSSTNSSNSGPNRNNGHENRNQTNRNSLLHDNDNETWGEDMISTLASSASLLSPKTPTPTPSTLPINKRPARTTKTAAISGDTSEHNCYSIGNTVDPFEQSSSVPKATTSSGLFTSVSQTSTLHSSAQPMSTANASSSACRSTNISSTIRSSPGKTGRRLSTLNHQLQRSTVSLPTSGSCLLGNSADHNAVAPSSSSSMEQTTSQYQRSSPPPGQRKAASTPVSSFQMDIVDSSTAPSIQYNQIYHHHPQVPSAFIMSHAPFGSMRISPSSTHTESVSTNSTQPSFSNGHTPHQPAIELAAIPDTHSGVIMASPGPGLSSSTPRSISPGNRWNRLMGFVRAVVSYTLLSRLFSRRPNYSSGNISSTSSVVNSWSVIRILNTCHLLYLVPVTTVTIARVLTTEVICNEQLFSWLTVQGVLFVLQIICSCYILQRQTMSSRIAILDQRSRILLLVFMIWTIIGVGFLGANNAIRDSSCMPSHDPVFSLAFKIIVFHSSLLGFYFLPCSSFLLSRVVPTSVSSGPSRTATKPMIDKLSSTPMIEGMFGGDPEEAVCAICLGEYAPDEAIRFLPCRHHFHLECVDQWLLTDKSCPLCKRDIDKPVVNDRNLHGANRNDEEANNNDHHHTTDSIMTSDRFQVIIT